MKRSLIYGHSNRLGVPQYSLYQKPVLLATPKKNDCKQNAIALILCLAGAVCCKLLWRLFGYLLLVLNYSLLRRLGCIDLTELIVFCSYEG